ncbi:MAG: hypothetical protein OXQ89_08920 [Rhodospirillaceae bacterium]|nr:hypothetical protein [Rhodospirillaceae bacterium]
MSRWTPCSRRVFVRRLRALGFDGPWSGSRHQFMVVGGHRLALPSNDEYSVPQLRMMLREVEAILGRRVGVDEWLRL